MFGGKFGVTRVQIAKQILDNILITTKSYILNLYQINPITHAHNIMDGRALWALI